MSKFISTQSIVLELPLRLDHLPAIGTEAPASVQEGAIVAGGFFVAATVARQGIAACVASPLGTGPNSLQARHSLGREGIAVLTSEIVGDIGIRIAAIDAEGVRTSVISPGVEAEPELHELEKLSLHENDWVLINLSDLSYPQAARVFSAWLDVIPKTVRLVVAGGFLVTDVDLDVLVKVLHRADLLTLNRNQADAVRLRLGRGSIAEVLRRYVQSNTMLVLRDGANGAAVQNHAGEVPQGIPTFAAEARDTTGVGEVHTGVLVASLMLGVPLKQATQRANAAAAVVLLRRGFYRIPTAAQIDDFMAQNSLS